MDEDTVSSVDPEAIAEAKTWLENELRMKHPELSNEEVDEQLTFLEDECRNAWEDPDGPEPEEPMNIAKMILENYDQEESLEEAEFEQEIVDDLGGGE
jgi:hypothetical protein